MSLLIKGMDMPKCCAECQMRYMAIGYDWECVFTNDDVRDYDQKRLSNCPLTEITSPHGRLVDEDQAQKNFENFVRGWCQDTKNDFNKYRDFAGVFIGMIKQAPTVIEAEGEQNE